MLLVVGGASFLMGFYAIKARDASQARGDVYQKVLFHKKKIVGGANDSVLDGDIISDDGVIGNPKKYPPSRTRVSGVC